MMKNNITEIINETFKNDLVIGIVYNVDGEEYCDWLQPSELSKNIFDDIKIGIKKFIFQNNEKQINISSSKKIINQIKEMAKTDKFNSKEGFRYFCLGLTSKEIAKLLNCSYRTVQNYMSSEKWKEKRENNLI